MGNKNLVMLSVVILAKLAEYEPINFKLDWWLIIVSYLICSLIIRRINHE